MADRSPTGVTAGDWRRASAILAAAIQGDRFGLSAGIAEAQIIGRTGNTVEAVAALLVLALPELSKTDVVDRLRTVQAKAGATEDSPVGAVKRPAKPANAKRKRVRRNMAKPPEQSDATRQFDDWLKG
jgi:hypothetical protein